MKNKNFQSIAKGVIEYEIKALKKLRSSIGNAFDQTIKTIWCSLILNVKTA